MTTASDDIRTVAKGMVVKFYNCKKLYDANVYDTIQTMNDTPRIPVHEV